LLPRILVDQLSNAELIELQFSSLTLFASEFQYWMSVTFAVVVAAFVAGERLSKPVRVWVAVLYVCVSVLFAARYNATLSVASEIGRYTALRGLPATEGAAVIGGLRALVFVLGTATVLWVLFWSRFSEGGSK
jgi:phosphatidylserine synthase